MALPSGLRFQKDSWFSQPHFLPTQVRKPRACGSSCGQSIRNVPGTGSDLSSGTLPTTPWPPRPPATAEAVCARTLKVLSSPAPQAGRAEHPTCGFLLGFLSMAILAEGHASLQGGQGEDSVPPWVFPPGLSLWQLQAGKCQLHSWASVEAVSWPHPSDQRPYKDPVHAPAGTRDRNYEKPSATAAHILLVLS
ncbi:uncharacterized protein LOC113892049 isoform X2 [Bos indicus x Bos taurus]|uniref:uncharacterized protein LOC113892049 isoform X2 n=1 Tax=Bos indicus x Bos taurus TaxID=30522 RepID=UPI000F7D55D9|nr:uncharacterized protein LOC113892049 isoform X2 [Bos indicus x Bos taurus]